MTEERTVKVTSDGSPAGRRNTGKPRKRWRDNLPKDYTEARMGRKTGNVPAYSRKKKRYSIKLLFKK